MNELEITAVQQALRKFASDRDWEQFHTPKNLAMAMSGEVGELTEIFQWLTPEQSKNVMYDPVKAEAVRDELADVMTYLLRLADLLSVDLAEAVWTKLRKNEQKYPVELARGNARKYSELE